MSLTPNYGFNIPTGTDAVNLLTQNYPNFTSLDSILKTIELTGITTATCTKVGTVFQLVRTNSALNVIRFVVTGNYAAGDTFTVDGVAVTATAVDGSSIPGGGFVINQSVMAILNGAVLTVLVSSGASTASGISYDNTGSGLAATNVQDAIDEVKADIPSIPATYDADDIVYDNTGSGLVATNVQDAIDELSNSNDGHELLGSVTANGVKTNGVLLDELYNIVSALDLSNPEQLSLIFEAPSYKYVYKLDTITSTVLGFSSPISSTSTSSATMQTLILKASTSKKITVTFNATSTSFGDESSTVASAGIKFSIVRN